MHILHSIHRISLRRAFIQRLLFALIFVCVPFTGILANTTTTYASGTPGGAISDPVVRAVDIARPAVVRIITELGGHLTVHFSSKNVTFPQGSATGYPIGLSGTGTFISSHGDILTADHVVNPPHDQSLSQYLDTLAAQDVAGYMNQTLHQSVTVDQVTTQLQSGQLPSDASYDPAVSRAYLSTDYTGSLTAPDFQSIPSSVYGNVDSIEKESAVTNSDVAIIHVPLNDMASVQLGDSSSVSVQDALTIIGFPGNGDLSTRPTNLLTSSINVITVSSIKTNDAGAQVIQVGGNVEHGDSGGPALNSSGSVVGIVSFGLVTPNAQGSTSFLQESNSARTLVQSLNLDTKPGAFQQAWSQAFNDYAATTSGHWHKAAQEFQQIATKYPQFKAITPYLTYTQGQAAHEPIPQNQPQNTAASMNPLLITMAVVLVLGVLLLLAVVFSVFMVRRRTTLKPAMTQASTMAQPQSFNGSYPHPQAPFTPIPPPLQNQTNLPGQSGQYGGGPWQGNDMSAFGAPPTNPTNHNAFSQSSGVPVPPSSTSGVLRPWPCGHMNRDNARFCSVCGEPTPPPPTIRRFEQ